MKSVSAPSWMCESRNVQSPYPLGACHSFSFMSVKMSTSNTWIIQTFWGKPGVCQDYSGIKITSVSRGLVCQGTHLTQEETSAVEIGVSEDNQGQKLETWGEDKDGMKELGWKQTGSRTGL